MPAGFDRCVRGGGRVRTKTLSDNRYMHICFDSKGKSHVGHVKTNERAKAVANAKRGK